MTGDLDDSRVEAVDGGNRGLAGEEVFHTFSIMARCTRTGMLGTGLASKALSVGARCSFIAPDAGIVLTQAQTDPRLGPAALSLLRQGKTAPEAIEQPLSEDRFASYRQLAALSLDGSIAVKTGGDNDSWAGHRIGPDYAVLGNQLPGSETLDAMARSFEADPDRDLEERIMRALEAGRDAGGQIGGQRSAAIMIFAESSFALVDLRVDLHDEPIGELRTIVTEYRSVKDWYTARAFDPRGGSHTAIA